MDTIFMNSKTSETSKPYRLVLTPTDKINLKLSKKYIPISFFSIYYTWKKIKKSYKNIELRIMNMTYLMGHVLYHRWKIILTTSLKNMKH